jgi:CRP-like cAMP-binding protein
MVNIFDGISNKNKEKLLRALKVDTLHYKKNESVLRLLQEKNMINFIVSGEVKLVLNNISGNEIVTDDLSDGDVFSQSITYIDETESDAIAVSDTEIISMNYSDIIDFKDNTKEYYNVFIKNLFIIMTEKIRERNERIQILTKKTIRYRLLEYFEIMRRKNNSLNIYLPFNFIDLAAYIAVDRSAMSRELGYLKEEGFIKMVGKRITLLYK